MKVEPDAWEKGLGCKPMPPPVGFRPGEHAIQPMRTLIVDLSGDEMCYPRADETKDACTTSAWPKKRGIVVKSSADLDTFYHLMEVTSQRDRFGVHTPEYYQRTYSLFHPKGQCELLLAEFDEEPVAALMVLAGEAVPGIFMVHHRKCIVR